MTLYAQIYKRLSDDIMRGKLKKNTRLPSVRKFADENGVSRNTVLNAYNQLLEEGFLYSKERSGYFVAGLERQPPRRPEHKRAAPPEKSAGEERARIDLSANLIDSAYFPYSTLRSLYREALSGKNNSLFDRSGDFRGEQELREAISEFLYEHRGISCSPSQIVIGGGTEYLLQLLIRIFSARDGFRPMFLMERPCYTKNIQAAAENGCAIMSVPLDEYGADISRAEEIRGEKGSLLLHISPAHQFPTGITMPALRRTELLQWAYAARNRFILEDDYDSDFRYKGRTLPALQRTDTQERVIFLGTFSRTLTPSMKISYLVLPRALATGGLELWGGYSCPVSRIDQHVVSVFIREGYLYRHINRVKKIYRQRRDLMICLLRQKIPGIEIKGEQCGLHFIIRLPGRTESECLRRARERGLTLQGTGSGWLVIGYAHLQEADITRVTEILAEL